MNFLFFNLLNDGGSTFMYPTLLMLIICIVLLVKAFLKSNENEKLISLVKHISLFALVWGFLGQMVGIISTFDSVESFGNVSPGILADGIKIALLNPVFGMFVFLISRLGLIGLTLKKK
ncbi:MotA/TolQ/ExbB proton channel family protein [Tenacibaculum retecalamus]|uniref:MotA/TolQ/ExbB proton channel family protein n=1 Tax=Tenacibaculum retecalamus TaxID=3018315 RepID=UPI0023D95FB5|nr:MotA/TolQ/ExbB proton channel family protein [Tenacibaculum retecalamus]WBX70805.1 MotA/TolQ/ExbB proton channel family protein [Tenacibaculum retecalamus]